MRVCDRCEEKNAVQSVLVPRLACVTDRGVFESGMWPVDLCPACMDKLHNLVAQQQQEMAKFAGLTKKWNDEPKTTIP